MPISAAAATAIGQGVTSIGNGFMGWLGNMYQAKKQREANKDMAEYAYSKDLEMWEKLNAYNTPAMQMQRYEDAGLNKNLIYSQGQPGQAASSMPKYNAPSQPVANPIPAFPTVLDIIDRYQDYQIKNQQKDILSQQYAIAKSTNIISQLKAAMLEKENWYTYPASFEDFGHKSLIEYNLDAKKLKNEQQKVATRKAMQELSIKEQEAVWKKLKVDTFLNTNVNIDKDALLERSIADIFGDLILNFKSTVKNSIK